LASQQLWKITCPAGLGITAIEELDIQAARLGKPVLTKNGVEYGLFPDTRKNEVILKPGSKGNFAQTTKPIDQGFVLRAINSEPATAATNAAPQIFTATQPGTPEESRKQPQGLQMRYLPFGLPAHPKLVANEESELLNTAEADQPSQTSPVAKSKKTSNKVAGKRKRD
jgi:hypothetical protein